VVSHFRECGNTHGERRAAVYRPYQEDTLAWRGYTFGLDVVARIGERRYRDHMSITKMRDQLKSDSNLAISVKEVAWRCEVFLALVTTVARQEPALIEPVRLWGGIVLAIDGVQPENSHATLDMLRDVRSGRVWVAKTWLSSATPEVEPLIEEGLGLDLPIGGVISDTQESSCWAVQRTLPTGPHQIGQYHDLKDVAQPVCAADRHVKQEWTKKVRGMSDLERQAEKVPTKAAPVVADSCLAMRAVMRDDGKYPLEPPGRQLYQKLQLIAASVERVMVAHPSALLKRLSRMLAVLPLFHRAFEPWVILFSWLHHIAHLFEAKTSCAQAPSPLLTCVSDLQHHCPHTELWDFVTYVQKITVALTPHLFAYFKHPLWPRTNNDLELFIGRLKTSRRHVTGRKHTQAFLLREGSFVAILCGLPQPTHWVEAFPNVNLNDFRHTLTLLRQTEKRRKCWHARRDVGAYLSALEQQGLPHEWVLQR
jgi:hypothetical protein